MLIAVIHGYFLRGTGSNLYVQNLCREFCRLGHEVHLFCQESAPGEFDFVARAYEFPADNLEPSKVLDRETPYEGKCVAFRPDLGGLLPVYVYDDYEGFTVKEYPDLTRDELEGYLERNRLALAHVFQGRRPALVLSQHTIMQPVYAARALRGAETGGTRHFMTVHGSCLNFSVRRSETLQEYAREAVAGGGPRHLRERGGAPGVRRVLLGGWVPGGEVASHTGGSGHGQVRSPGDAGR